MPSLDFHQGTLRLKGVTQQFVSAALSNVPLVFDSRDACFRCDAIHYAALRETLSTKLRGAIEDSVLPDAQIAIPVKQAFKLRPDQQSAVSQFLEGNRRGLIVMPTGTGKTVVAIELMQQLQTSTLVVAPVRDLMYQWHQRILQSTGIDAGIIGDGVHRVSPISVTTYDSAVIHMPRIGNKFSFLVFDEVHHLAGTWRSDAARMSVAPFRLGLTATLPTDDQRSGLLHQIVGPTLYEQTIDQASGDSLADYTIQRLAVTMTEAEQQRYKSLSKIVQTFVADQRELDPGFCWEDAFKLTANADDEPELAAVAATAIRAFRMKRRIEERPEGKLRLLEDLFRLHAGEPVLVFVGSNAMAREISLRFMVPCLLSHCAKRERADLLSGFAEGRYPVLVANRVLDEGVDLPTVKVAIVLGGMSSKRQAIQRLGRVLRRGDGNRKATLYEVVTNETNEVDRSRKRRRNRAYRPGKK